METTSCEILNICRFCLSRDNLIPLSKTVNCVFTLGDIEYYTGIQLSEEERPTYAICDSCCKILESSVAFRDSCLSNDTLFKQLIRAQHLKVNDKLHEHEDTSQFDETSSVESENDNTDPFSATSNPEENTGSIKNEMQEMENVTNPTPPNGRLHSRKKWHRKKQLCVTCGQLVSNLTRHTRNHTKEKKYTCPHCQVKMTNPTNMKRHINAVHLKKIIMSCEICGKGFTHKNTYLSHMISQHGIGKTYECEICSRTFKQPGGYRSHFNRWHNIKREFTCSICNMTFKDKRALTIHQRVHSTDQPYACSQCPKRFKSQYARKTHQLTHSGVRFSCTICEKSYRYKSLLSMHYRKDHPNKAPLEGDECENTLAMD